MGWDDTERVTYADIRDRWTVNDSALRRHHKTGQFTGEQDNTGQWTFDRSEVDAHAPAKGWPRQQPEPDTAPLTLSPSIDAADIERRSTELAELRAQATIAADTIKRATAERDQARNDHEHERNRADTAERETIKHRAVAEERAAIITRLEANMVEIQTEVDKQRERAVAAEALNTVEPEPLRSPERSPVDVDQGNYPKKLADASCADSNR